MVYNQAWQLVLTGVTGCKMKPMDRQLLVAYRDRWRAVEAVEREERRVTSLALRWQQTNAIFRLAMGMGLLADDSPDDQELEVYRRWARLKGVR
jgi:hypothetical protein